MDSIIFLITKRGIGSVRKIWTILVIVVLVLALVGGFVRSYNNLVNLETEVDAQWAQVENQLQRRWDLIPNLVETTKGYMQHEQEVFSNIADARAKLAGASTTSDKIEAANELEGALSRLLVVVENYPNLKANENFLALSTQLEGTENRIAVERQRYNEAVAEWNKTIKRLPTVLLANMLGKESRTFFEVSSEARENPKVSF